MLERRTGLGKRDGEPARTVAGRSLKGPWTVCERAMDKSRETDLGERPWGV
ncbi:hypothetical protein STRIP9103_05980 [Streptomyces ipomoeae 91-03]|uniref:Uncharacterized protein n=1 Tax=Streptomyces ipomoeae 91-03 TaxID=698759 RepID=L1L544_9ACTN|nr:hypothetical protein STRIP9103_05980 [Streptomyces ipomoeae 91-03]